MKRCPQCSTEYDDKVSFCAKDGRSLVSKGGIRTKLCSHCANSIAEDALKCPYCKADLSSTPDPQWPTREADPLEARLGSKKHKTSVASKAILITGLLVFGIGVFLIGGQRQRSESQSLLEERLAQLRDKDQKFRPWKRNWLKRGRSLRRIRLSLCSSKTSSRRVKEIWHRPNRN